MPRRLISTSVVQDALAKLKVRSFGDAVELEEVFEAVFEWIERNHADEFVRRMRHKIREAIDSETEELGATRKPTS